MAKTKNKTDLQKMPVGYEGGAIMEVRPAKPVAPFGLFQTQLKEREGIENKIYKDKEGILHGGIGHKLVGEELKKYKVGDPIPQQQIDSWFNQDSKNAWESAGEKAVMLGNEKLQSVLAPLDFQLGENWNTDHIRTWGLLEQGDYAGAAKEAEDSKWFIQTPKRVGDFQEGLLGATQKPDLGKTKAKVNGY